MQTEQLTIENRTNNLSNHLSNIEQTNESRSTVRTSGWLGRVFGCWHREMSRPFSNDGQTYRACLNCGARRSFNIGTWEMRGDFYYSLPTSKHFRALNGLPPAPPKRRTKLGDLAQPIRQYA